MDHKLQALSVTVSTNGYVIIPTYYNTTPPTSILGTAAMLTAEGLTRWASANKAKLSVAANTYTASIANLPNLISKAAGGLYSSTYYTLPLFGQLPPGTFLKDLGKDIYIGVPGQANIFHFRLVQAPGILNNLGNGGWTGYVCVENNTSTFSDYVNFPQVSVARV